MANGDEKHSRKWRYTWEAQTHIPTLRLLLFAKNASPSLQCLNLKVQLLPSQSLVAVSWFEPALVSLRVPIPRVLVDFESPVSFRALDDHIEVKLLLLLPVDHPIVSSFDSVMNLSDDPLIALPDVSKPLVMGSGNLNVLVRLFDNNRIRDFKVISRLKFDYLVAVIYPFHIHNHNTNVKNRGTEMFLVVMLLFESKLDTFLGGRHVVNFIFLFQIKVVTFITFE